MRKLLFIFFSVFVFALIAQKSVSSADFTELEAFESFQTRQYQRVIGNLKRGSSLSEGEEILLLMSEMKTGKRDASKIEGWLADNEKHPIKPLVAYHLGEYFFYNQDTLKSRSYLSSVSANELSTADRASYGFIYGVLQLNEENYQNAKDLFRLSRNHAFEETAKLDYYEAYANYHLNDLTNALEGFEKVKGNEAYGNSAKFFIAKIRLENKQVDEVIALAQEELSDETTITNSGFYQLIGEAYALKNDVAKADAYFERAIELHPSKPTAALYYQAGVSKFKIGNEDQAIKFLTEAGIQGGEYAQLSAFQLGRLYLKKQSFEQALFAYIEASASENKAIKEEALYQSAKINAQLGNFAEAINYANDYLELFGSGGYVTELQDLIAQSYLRTSNFDLAIEHLKRIGVTNPTQKDIYQKVTYQKAVLSFNDGLFEEARTWFQESLKYAPSLDLKDQALFHLGEIAMRENNFEMALKYYQSQTKINSLTDYGIGYAYYNKQLYANAIPHFRRARNTNDQRTKTDASVRLADCLFATKSYDEAVRIYDQASVSNHSSYIDFRKGSAMKRAGSTDEAIQTFQKVFTSSKYGAAARFEVGMIHFESAQFKDAENIFTQVVSNYPNSSLVPDALLNRGIARKNLGKMDEAKADYSNILENHLSSQVSLNAILGLQELQQAGVDVNKLDKYIADYKQANPESGSLELIEFEAAKRLYFDFSYAEATRAFDRFLKDYPASGNKIEAKYYLADSYYRIDQLEQSKVVFDELKYVRNPLTGRILSRVGDINTQLGNISEAKDAYQLLMDLNLTSKDTYNARQGLMMLYFTNNQFTESIAMADEVIRAEWKPLNAGKEASMIKAKSYLNLRQTEMARLEFESLASDKNVVGAEANYFLGLIAYNNEAHDQSLDLLFDLNSNYGSYQDWIDKSYLLIAKNYIAQEELFQAKATLRSIIQHAKNEDVKSEAQRLLNQIEQNANISDSTQSNK
ncbi:tetratricopeptide repeat protein [Ekhidna sp.]|uniref:tetratricopeptide repeat protein n=1 Tax=Ekhidna sp. TaxID=2608089 RepID=UPI003C7C64CD